MKDKEAILDELDEKFVNAKKELKFNSSFDELESVFFIKDAVLSAGFVSDGFSRQLRARITDIYKSWMSFLHGLIMPNPQNIVNLNESKLFSSEEKKDIGNLIGLMMSVISRSDLVNLTNDKTEEAKMIDDSFIVWKETVSPFLIKVMSKIDRSWVVES